MKLLAFVLAYMLLTCTPCIGIAENLQTQIAAPDHIEIDEVKSPTGFTTIKIDASVLIPNVETVSVYEIIPKAFSEDEISNIALALGFENAKDVVFKEKSSSNGNWTSYIDYTQQEYSTSNKTHYFDAFNGFSKGKVSMSSINCRPRRSKFEFSTNGTLYSYINGYQGGNTYSLEQAITMANDVATKIAPDLTLHTIGILAGIEILSNEMIDAINSSQGKVDFINPVEEPVQFAYGFVFSREVDGIPITVTSCRSATDNEYAPPFSYERLYITISSNGIDCVEYLQPYKLGDNLESRVTLLPFDEVLNIAKATLPLKLVAEEGVDFDIITDADHQVTINRIEFGYMRVLIKGEQNRYKLVPVWDFFGIKDYTVFCAKVDGGIWKTLNYYDSMKSYLTINAIDGTIIDRQLGY